MKKLLVSLALALLVASGCGSGEDESSSATTTSSVGDSGDGSDEVDLTPAEPQPVVALPADTIAVTINGVETNAGDLAAFLEAWWELESEAEGALRDDPFRISQFIRFESFVQDVESTHGELTDEQLAATTESLDGVFPETAAGDTIRTRVTRWQAALDQLSRDYFEANPAEFADQICSSHILFGVEEEADEAADATALEEAEAAIVRLGDGEDFAALALELSTDPSAAGNAGDLGCVGPGAFVPEFEEAAIAGEVGETIGPVRSAFGYHIIVTRDPSFDELKSTIEQTIATQTELAIADAVANADVVVDDAYGTWDPISAILTPADS